MSNQNMKEKYYTIPHNSKFFKKQWNSSTHDISSGKSGGHSRK